MTYDKMTNVERVREAWRLRARDIVAKHYDYEVVENVSEHCAEVDFVLQGVVAALQSAAPVEDDVLLRELRDLAVVLHRKHYPEVTQWRPLSDARGILSQIDNMTTGLERLSSTGGQGNG